MMPNERVKYIVSRFCSHLINKLPTKSSINVLRRENCLTEYRFYERAYSAYHRNEMDLSFLNICLENKVAPKFILTSKLPQCLSKQECNQIHMKVLRKKVQSQKSLAMELNQKLCQARRDLFNKVGHVLFSFCIKLVVRVFQTTKTSKAESHEKKLRQLNFNSAKERFCLNDTVKNISGVQLSQEEMNILKFGLNHGIKRKVNWRELQVKLEELYHQLTEKNIVADNAQGCKDQMRFLATQYFNRNRHNSEKEHKILLNLKKKNLRICPFDKGNGTVIMSNDQYAEKMSPILDSSQFQQIKLRKNALPPNIKLDEAFSELLDSVRSSKGMLKEAFTNFRQISSNPAKLYGQPKVHKDNMPMRPILSTVGTMNHAVAQVIDKILKPLINNDKLSGGTFEFVNEIANRPVSSEEEVMVSFDVKSLFTMVPLEETIELCGQLYQRAHGNEDLSLFKKLLRLCIKDVPFLYNDQWWQQSDGVSMGSPLAPTMATIFMNNLEEQLSQYTGQGPIYYSRYVDDIFLIFKSRSNIEPFFAFMNDLHSNIEFTKEEESNHALPFLDVLVTRSDGQYNTSQFFKKTDTGLYTSPFSECDPKYKNNLLKCLITRAYRIGSNYKSITTDIERNRQRLIKCGYHEDDIDKAIDHTVTKERTPRSTIDKSQKEHITVSLQFGNGYKEMRKGLEKIIKDNDSEDKFISRIIFRTTKVSSYFSNKSRTPNPMCPAVVYEFKCHGCDAQYVGETERHLRTRSLEHGQKSRKSAVLDHLLQCNKRRTHLSPEEFSIISKNMQYYRTRKIYEALEIQHKKPVLNIQKDEFGIVLKLFV